MMQCLCAAMLYEDKGHETLFSILEAIQSQALYTVLPSHAWRHMEDALCDSAGIDKVLLGQWPQITTFQATIALCKFSACDSLNVEESLLALCQSCVKVSAYVDIFALALHASGGQHCVHGDVYSCNARVAAHMRNVEFFFDTYNVCESLAIVESHLTVRVMFVGTKEEWWSVYTQPYIEQKIYPFVLPQLSINTSRDLEFLKSFEALIEQQCQNLEQYANKKQAEDIFQYIHTMMQSVSS